MMAPRFQGFIAVLLPLLSHHPHLAAPQTVPSQITIPLYGPSWPPIAQAAILGYSQGTTTVKLVCDANSTAAGCVQQLMNTYTLAPGIQNMRASDDGQYTVTEDCTVTATATMASCTDFESAGKEFFPAFSPTMTNYNYTTTYTTIYGQAEVTTFTLDVIDGADLLPNSSSSSRLASATSVPSSNGLATTSSTTQQAMASSTSSNPMQTATAASRSIASKGPLGFGALAAAAYVAVLHVMTG